MITASAKIWGTFGNPFIAIPMIALMWGSFIASKVRANQLASQEFGDGGLEILGGGTHASGNDTVIGYNNGYQLKGEKNEAVAVINSKNTSKYRNVLPDIVDSLNRGVFEEMFVGDQLGGHADVHLNLDDMPQNMRKMANRKSTVVDGAGRRIETYKNLTTIYSS